MTEQTEHIESNETSVKANAIALSEVVYKYPSSTATLNCDNWEVQQGAHVFMHGDSGSGKSTLLSLISGIARPLSGSIVVNGTSFNELSSSKLDTYRAKNIGVVFQQFNLIPYLSVIQNIQLAAYFAKSRIDVRDKVESMMESVKLSSAVLDANVSQLSVGQKQRVAIMRALINSPDLLLIDEPTSALDVGARDGFMQMLLAMSKANNASMVFVSHDPSLKDHFSEHVEVSDICHWRGRSQEPVC